jgi:subtilase family serine protease
MRTLDCGHEPSPHSEHTTGTAHTADGREVCWTCADSEHRESLKSDKRTTGYLSGDGSAITTWTGGVLMTVTRENQTRAGFGHGLTYLRATDTHGQQWYGSSPGRNMYASLRRSK